MSAFTCGGLGHACPLRVPFANASEKRTRRLCMAPQVHKRQLTRWADGHSSLRQAFPYGRHPPKPPDGCVGPGGPPGIARPAGPPRARRPKARAAQAAGGAGGAPPGPSGDRATAGAQKAQNAAGRGKGPGRQPPGGRGRPRQLRPALRCAGRYCAARRPGAHLPGAVSRSSQTSSPERQPGQPPSRWRRRRQQLP